MNKQKRMIYIYEENVDFYDALENKSALVNDILTRERLKNKPNENMDFVRQKIAEIDARSKKAREQ